MTLSFMYPTTGTFFLVTLVLLPVTVFVLISLKLQGFKASRRFAVLAISVVIAMSSYMIIYLFYPKSCDTYVWVEGFLGGVPSERGRRVDCTCLGHKYWPYELPEERKNEDSLLLPGFEQRCLGYTIYKEK